MKLHLFFSALGVSALAALLPPAVHAQSVSYSTGDLLLGFEEPGSANQYIVDLGSVSYFLTLSQSPGTTNITTSDYSGAGLGNIAADLANATYGFGSNWYANNATQGTNVQWGIFGASNTIGSGLFGAFTLPANTLFETIAESVPGQGSSAPLENSNSNQKVTNGIFSSFSSGFKGSSATANSAYGTFSPTITWSSENPSVSAFGSGVNIEQPQSAGLTAIGPTNSQLDLYELNPSTTGGTGVELGSFTLDSSGNLFFTSAASVPEPSTVATVGLGAGLLLFFSRRRKTA